MILDPAPVLREAAWTVDLTDRDRSAHLPRKDLGERSAVALGLLTWKWFPLRKAVPAARHLDMQVMAAHAPSFAANPYDPAPVHR